MNHFAFGARLIADDVVWWRRRANKSLDASRTSELLIEKLRVTQLRAAASTPPFDGFYFSQDSLLINGIDIIYIIPPIVLGFVAVLVGLWQFRKHGIKRAIISLILVLLFGALFLFVLFVIWIVVYYAGGGH